MQESTVTSRGHTTLPRDVRAALELGPGDRVRYIIRDGEVRMLKARPVSELAGFLARPGQAAVSLDEMDEAIAEIEVEAAGDVAAALLRYRDQGLGFADQMVAAAARRSGASRLVTFVRSATRIEGVELLQT